MAMQLNHKYRHHGSLYIKPLKLITRIKGLTLIELLVVLVILSILASVALPYAQVIVQRNKEVKLRIALREIRTAIDRFHEDWKTGKISHSNDMVSQYGFPTSLTSLVEGVEHTTIDDVKHKYLRRIPINPFADPTLDHEEHWQYRSYQDESDTDSWGGQDVYDAYVSNDKKGLDGTKYKNW